MTINCLKNFLVFVSLLACFQLGVAEDPKPEDFFLQIRESFSFIALSGHRINYSKEDNTLTIVSPGGEVLASGEPSFSRSAFPRQKYFQHGFSVYSPSGDSAIEFSMVLRTKLELPQNREPDVAIDPRDFVDTKSLVSTSFWITDPMTEKEVLSSSLFETEEEISKFISLGSAGSCKAFLN